ncbi:hypothetical protein EXIGLDRAFT_790296 [Exidia glandulosa HHB12029]|uniref:Uncharacterized protein n=1 Tax=Exidia glandulosa HHB12029 TaxID=1314781 RepID=A0A165HT63_EXIGL|nr:hypothetical protein EXIGLDRAFT_790296 [Exidia glandulosa HHB12029]
MLGNLARKLADLHDHIAEQDAKIEELTLSLDAALARCSALQARLNATFDALDVAQSTREVEERTTRTALELAARAEEERDDLRDAVGLLIAKVELEGDYRILCAPMLKLGEPVRPIHPRPHAKHFDNDADEGDHEQAQTFVPSLMTSLTLQLDAERRRRADLELHVTTLEAQLARRDAELEAHIHVVHIPARTPEDVKFGREKALDVLDRTLARNRALEAEVRNLDEVVKAARLQDPPTRVKTPPPRPSSSRQTLVAPVPPSPPKRPSTPLRPSLVNHFTSPGKRPRLTSPPPRTHSAPPVRPGLQFGRTLVFDAKAPLPFGAPLERHGDHEDDEDVAFGSLLRPASPPAGPLRRLDEHLDALHLQETELAAERERLARVVVAEPETGGPDDEARARFQRVSILEEECVRLRRRVRELELERRADDVDGGRGYSSPHEHEHEHDPNEPSASPHDQDLDPDRTIRALSHPPHSRPAQDRMAQLAADLSTAREEVESKERAMEELRMQIDALRRDMT